MGKSKSIEQQIKEDKRNQEFLDELQKKLQEDSAAAVAEIDARVQEFYEDRPEKWDHSPFILGEQTDYQLSSSWSLANLSEIVNKVADAVMGTVIGKDTKLPEGIEADPDANDVAEVGGFTKDMRLMVATNCFNLLSGILNSFGATNSVMIKQASQNVPIGQGLRIFAHVAMRNTKNKSFFHEQVVNSYMFVFQVVYSLDEFKQQAEQTLVAQYERTLNALNIASERVYNEFVSANITIEQYMDTSDRLELRTKEVINKINSINSDAVVTIMLKQLQWLRTQKIEFGHNSKIRDRIEAMIDNMLPQIHSTLIPDTA